MIKTALKYLVVAMLLGVVTFVLLLAGRLERQLAQADRNMATLNLSRAAQGYDQVADALAVTGRIPWLLRGTRDEVAASRAAVRYWRGDYAPLTADYTSAESPSITGNLDLQFVVANADYRSVLQPDTSRELALGMLDHAVNVYARLLESNEDHLEAAFNYELMVRLRNQVAGGGDIPEFSLPRAPGSEGENMEADEIEDIQIYVPADTVFELNSTDDPTMGDGAPIRRRG